LGKSKEEQDGEEEREGKGGARGERLKKPDTTPALLRVNFYQGCVDQRSSVPHFPLLFPWA
jgi:hypothetical protein